jgi:hypothetical protein
MNMFHNTEDLTDSGAMDWIAEILTDPEWDPDTLALIARIVEMTGRDISPREDEDNDER